MTRSDAIAVATAKLASLDDGSLLVVADIVQLMNAAEEWSRRCNPGYEFGPLASGQDQALQGLPSKTQEQHRCQQRIQHGRAQQAAKDGHGHRMQYLASGFAGADEQWREREARRQGGHIDGSKPLKTAADNEAASEFLAFVQSQIDVVGDFQDAVAGCDPGEGNKSDH